MRQKPLKATLICILLSTLLVCQVSAASPIPPDDYEKSLPLLQKSFDLFPYNAAVKEKLATAYLNIGQSQLKRKLYDEAAESFARASELFPDRQEYGILRGVSLYLGRRYDEAAYELEQARLEGETAELLFYLGRVKYDTGNLTEALDLWDRALALDQGNSMIRALADKVRREAAVESGMGKGFRSVFEISYDEGTMSDLADDVLKALEAAYKRVGSDFSHYPSVRVPVVLYTRKDFRSVTAGPEWSGGVYDGKVRLPIGGATEVTPVLSGVLAHEYTHAVVRELTKGNCPSWLNEGLAEVEGRVEYNPPLAALEAAAKKGGFLPFTKLEKSLLGMSSSEAQLAYQQSYSLVKYIIDSYGWHMVREVLVNLGNGKSIEVAIAEVFASFTLDYALLVQEWQVHTIKEYVKY